MLAIAMMVTLEMDGIALVSTMILVDIFSVFTDLLHELWKSFADIDECLTKPCHVNASCTDNEGSYVCHCNDGYTGNGRNCSSEYCTMILTDYFSMLTDLFHDLWKSFADIDECLTKPCHVNASCMDNQGSFTCQCNDGFTGSGLNCSSEYNLS